MRGERREGVLVLSLTRSVRLRRILRLAARMFVYERRHFFSAKRERERRKYASSMTLRLQV
jgi:hypothetical protein